MSRKGFFVGSLFFLVLPVAVTTWACSTSSSGSTSCFGGCACSTAAACPSGCFVTHARSSDGGVALACSASPDDAAAGD
jgi:hypothetical protein